MQTLVHSSRSSATLSSACDAVRGIMLTPAPSVREWLAGVARATSAVSPSRIALAALAAPARRGDSLPERRLVECAVAAPDDVEPESSLALQRLLAIEAWRDAPTVPPDPANPMILASFDSQERGASGARAQGRAFSARVLEPELCPLLRAAVAVQVGGFAGALFLELRGSRPQWKPGAHERAVAAQLVLAASDAWESRIARVLRTRRRMLDHLSITQRTLLPLLITGLSEREIARRVSRSAHTVHDHARAVCIALAVADRFELRRLWNSDDSGAANELQEWIAPPSVVRVS